MTDPTAELNAVLNDYTRGFAGRPRATRDLAKLDGLIGRLEVIQSAPAEIGLNARTTLESYRRERTLIAEVQAGGDLARKAQARNALSNLATRRYQRHFAKQQRWTRDLALLEETVGNLRRWKSEAEEIAKSWDHSTFAESRQRAASLATTYAAEVVEIQKAIQTGSQADRATALANRANNVFRWYRLCFAGKSRLGRRPALLDRLITELSGIEAGMAQLVQSGYRTEAHDKNLALVADRVKLYRGEVAAIRRVQGDEGYPKVFEAVAAAANELFEQYRKDFAGKSRTAADPEKLADLCDTIYEVALHMDELDASRGEARNLQNLLIVLENISLYEAEVDRIREARGAN